MCEALSSALLPHGGQQLSNVSAHNFKVSLAFYVSESCPLLRREWVCTAPQSLIENSSCTSTSVRSSRWTRSLFLCCFRRRRRLFGDSFHIFFSSFRCFTFFLVYVEFLCVLRCALASAKRSLLFIRHVTRLTSTESEQKKTEISIMTVEQSDITFFIQIVFSLIVEKETNIPW